MTSDTLLRLAVRAIPPGAPRLNFLADFIESAEEPFSMSNFSTCESPQCIMGWAVHFWGDPDDPQSADLAGFRAIFGITDRDLAIYETRLADEIAYARRSRKSLSRITREHAANMLRRFATGGAVDWNASDPDVPEADADPAAAWSEV